MAISKSLMIFIVAVSTAHAFANSVQEERIYDEYAYTISRYPALIPMVSVSQPNKKLLVDALWDAVFVNKQPHLSRQIEGIDDALFKQADQVRLSILRSFPKRAQLNDRLATRILQTMQLKEFERSIVEQRTLLTVFAYRSLLASNPVIDDILDKLGDIFKKKKFRTKTKAEVKDLFFQTPGLEAYKGGKYANGVRLFMFCRKSRKFPCRILMKGKDGQPVLTEDGQQLWSQPALGLSRRNKPYNVRNGNTPSGVYTIDSVMPHANKQRIYGKFRRFIINFVPKSANETFHKHFLPPSALDKKWWKQAVAARDVGRNLLRIHGTGIIRSTPMDPYHPLRPTFGCVMQREGFVSGARYKDQRILLDHSMRAVDLEPVFKNETKLVGALYVIDLDNLRRSVTYADLQNWLDL